MDDSRRWIYVDIQGGPKMAQFYLVRLNFIKYQPIFTIILLPETGENV